MREKLKDETARPIRVIRGHQNGERKRGEDARDRVLVRRMLAGDCEAYEELYRLYERRIFSLCMRICGNGHDAADAMHEAFMVVRARLPELDIDELSFGGYLYVCSRRVAVGILRRRELPVDEIFAADDQAASQIDILEDPEGSLLLSDQQRLVQMAHRRLPRRQREVLALREIEGLSYAQIALAMDMKENAVAQLLCRARVRLRREIRGGSTVLVSGRVDCRRAAPLLAQGVESALAGEEQRWLDQHLDVCNECAVNREAMTEAGASLRTVVLGPATAAIWSTLSSSLSGGRDRGSFGLRLKTELHRHWHSLQRPLQAIVEQGALPLIAAAVVVGSSGPTARQALLPSPDFTESVVASRLTTAGDPESGTPRAGSDLVGGDGSAAHGSGGVVPIRIEAGRDKPQDGGPAAGGDPTDKTPESGSGVERSKPVPVPEGSDSDSSSSEGIDPKPEGGPATSESSRQPSGDTPTDPQARQAAVRTPPPDALPDEELTLPCQECLAKASGQGARSTGQESLATGPNSGTDRS